MSKHLWPTTELLSAPWWLEVHFHTPIVVAVKRDFNGLLKVGFWKRQSMMWSDLPTLLFGEYTVTEQAFNMGNPVLPVSFIMRTDISSGTSGFVSCGLQLFPTMCRSINFFPLLICTYPKQKQKRERALWSLLISFPKIFPGIRPLKCLSFLSSSPALWHTWYTISFSRLWL